LTLNLSSRAGPSLLSTSCKQSTGFAEFDPAESHHCNEWDSNPGLLSYDFCSSPSKSPNLSVPCVNSLDHNAMESSSEMRAMLLVQRMAKHWVAGAMTVACLTSQEAALNANSNSTQRRVLPEGRTIMKQHACHVASMHYMAEHWVAGLKITFLRGQERLLAQEAFAHR